MATVAVIGPAESEAIAAVVRHASEHVYDASRPKPELLANTPGNDSRHVVQLGNVRVVYSHTLAPCGFRRDCSHLYHHLTMSIIGAPPGVYPNKVVAAEIAKLFGVREPWSASGVSHFERCVVILKEIEPRGHA